MSSGNPARLTGVVAISLFLYCAGLILNDVFDIERDRSERPDRPIASGKISRRTAVGVAVFLDAAALALASRMGMATIAAAGTIAILAILYNGPARRWPVCGVLVMGLCRGANLVLGATVVMQFPPVVWGASAIEVAYVAALTAAAAGETHGPPVGMRRWAPPIAMAAGMVAILTLAGMSAAGIIVAAIPVAVVVGVAVSMKPTLPADAVPPKIGQLIRAIIPLQAVFVLALSTKGLTPVCLAGSLYILWLLAHLAGKRFKGS